ncbi:MAG: transporter substrate-binding domain-containing protein [Tannerella sp.]|jgi:membrane-bound lytic murein transglycosylase MltF|nr:transporter substrate-binding domain-containing protein [Tannerella sp.]
MFSKKLLLLYVILLLLTLVTMAVLFFTTPAAPPLRDYPQIADEGILRIVTEYNQSGYYLSDDTIEGFQYELSKAIAALSGLEVLIFPEMSLEKSFNGLWNCQYDIVAQNIPITSEMRQHYLFADPIVLSKQVLVQRTAGENNPVQPVRNHLDLAKQTLHIPRSSPVSLRLHSLQHEIGDTLFIVEDPLYSAEQLIIQVAKGDIDYAVCDGHIARLLQKQFPEIDIQTDISFTQLQSWAVRKNAPVLLDSLNSWFRTMRAHGTFDRIHRTYNPSK